MAVGGEPGGGPPPPRIDLGIAGITEAVEIGRGGFARVYRARRQPFDQSVAVKVLSATLDQQARQRFDREVSAMVALFGHQNIVGIISSGYTLGDLPYIVMEDMSGGSLADAIQARGPLSWQDATEIGVGLASALDAAHSAKVLHGDVKPENVFYSRYGAAKLGDFGLAVLVDEPAEKTRALVSIVHTPPEIFDRGGRTFGTDVYSLASTIMTLILGRPPFSGGPDESTETIIRRITSDPPPDLRRQGVPDPVCRVLEKALAKTPEQRYSSAADFRADLERGREASLVAAAAGPGKGWGRPAIPAAAATQGQGGRSQGGGGQFQRRSGAGVLRGLLVANPVLAAIVAVVVLAGGGTGIGLALSHGSPSTPTPTLPPTGPTPTPPGPTPIPTLRPFAATQALLQATELPSGSWQANSPVLDFGNWACVPQDPSLAGSDTATGAYEESFTDSSTQTQVTVLMSDYVYEFPSVSAASAFLSAAKTQASHCTGSGTVNFPTPPNAGDQSFRATYENSSKGENDITYVRVANAVTTMVAASSAEQWDFFASSVATTATNAAGDLTSASQVG